MLDKINEIMLSTAFVFAVALCGVGLVGSVLDIYRTAIHPAACRSER